MNLWMRYNRDCAIIYELLISERGSWIILLEVLSTYASRDRKKSEMPRKREEKADCHGEIIDLKRGTKTGIIGASFEEINQVASYNDK